MLGTDAGVVVEFDDHRGIGVIKTSDGRRFGFHCTQIVGGSRTIASETAVKFEIVAGPLGRLEATSITPV